MPQGRVERKAVYVVKDIEGPEGKRGYWTRIGTAFVNRDGSLNVELEALPVSGRLHIRDFPAEDQNGRRDERRGRADDRGQGRGQPQDNRR